MDYHFDSRQLTRGAAIPAGFQPLIGKVTSHLSLQKEIGELLVLEYLEGAVINWHRDAPPFDVIVGISLFSDCTFMLRPHDKAKRSRKAIIRVPIERRSLYVMQIKVAMVRSGRTLFIYLHYSLLDLYELRRVG